MLICLESERRINRSRTRLECDCSSLLFQGHRRLIANLAASVNPHGEEPRPLRGVSNHEAPMPMSGPHPSRRAQERAPQDEGIELVVMQQELTQLAQLDAGFDYFSMFCAA